jgi:hypothetical protein
MSGAADWESSPYSDTDDSGYVYAVGFHGIEKGGWVSPAPLIKVGYTARPVEEHRIYQLTRVMEAYAGRPVGAHVLWQKPGSLRLEIYLQAHLAFDYDAMRLDSGPRKRDSSRHPRMVPNR